MQVEPHPKSEIYVCRQQTTSIILNQLNTCKSQQFLIQKAFVRQEGLSHDRPF